MVSLYRPAPKYSKELWNEPPLASCPSKKWVHDPLTTLSGQGRRLVTALGNFHLGLPRLSKRNSPQTTWKSRRQRGVGQRC